MKRFTKLVCFDFISSGTFKTLLFKILPRGQTSKIVIFNIGVFIFIIVANRSY